jgi:exosortase/archaeosortase family protein
VESFVSVKSPAARTSRPQPGRGARAVRVVVECAAFWGGALWLVSRFPSIEAFGIRVTLATVRGTLALFGLHVVQSGRILRTTRAAIEIAPDCSPHLPFLIFAGVVLATPATWRERAAGLVFGALAIHVFNVARILALFGVLATRPGWFDFVHIYLWQIGTIVAVLAVFAAWLAWTGRRARTA